MSQLTRVVTVPKGGTVTGSLLEMKRRSMRQRTRQHYHAILMRYINKDVQAWYRDALRRMIDEY